MIRTKIGVSIFLVFLIFGASSAWALRKQAFIGCYIQSINNLKSIAATNPMPTPEELQNRLGFLTVMAAVWTGVEVNETMQLRRAAQESKTCAEFTNLSLAGLRSRQIEIPSYSMYCSAGTMPMKEMLNDLGVSVSTLLGNSELELKRIQRGSATELFQSHSCQALDNRFVELAIEALEKNRNFVSEVFDIL